MILTPLCSLESARKQFLMNSTYIMSKKWESNVLGLERPKMTLTPLSSLESAKKKFLMTLTQLTRRT